MTEKKRKPAKRRASQPAPEAGHEAAAVAAVFELGQDVESFVREGCGPHDTPSGRLDCPDCVAYLTGGDEADEPETETGPEAAEAAETAETAETEGEPAEA